MSCFIGLLCLALRVKNFFLEIFYFFQMKTQLLREKFSVNINVNIMNDYNNNSSDRDDLNQVKEAANKAYNKTMQCQIDVPKHVCIVLNETSLNGKPLVNAFSCIIDTYTSIGIRFFTFYKYSGITIHFSISFFNEFV